ncbi:tyrosine-type recombinase/integrase [Streptomyces sp. NPDC059814]|uniref:tyrosine-type recombinase/integrase n=1 Tax=Streptomyces sp. NPDC059814 TaxID=3346959 RepID=UPI0036548727
MRSEERRGSGGERQQCRGAGRVPGARADPLQHAEAGEAEAPQGGGVPRGVPAPVGPGGDRALRDQARHHEVRLPATRSGRLLHGRHGTTPGEEALQRPPAGGGVGMYGFRHYFASNALGNGLPINDVAEWMGHKSIEETYRTYRHLMPGSITKAARILDTGL